MTNLIGHDKFSLFLRHQKTKSAIFGITRLIIKSQTKLLPLFLYLLGCQEPTPQTEPILTTGTTSATYYPVGVALATLVSADQDSAFSLSAISSGGSLENAKLLRDNQAQLATMLSIFATWAYEGEGPILNPQSHLRAVTAPWPNVEHLLLKSELVTDGTFQILVNSMVGESDRNEKLELKLPVYTCWINLASITKQTYPSPILATALLLMLCKTTI